MTVQQLEEGRTEVENQYSRSVRREGNRSAQELIHKIFEITDRTWRGIGTIPQSGYRLRNEFSAFDAEQVFRCRNYSNTRIVSLHCRSGAARIEETA